jgi:hypothetical protein
VRALKYQSEGSWTPAIQTFMTAMLVHGRQLSKADVDEDIDTWRKLIHGRHFVSQLTLASVRPPHTAPRSACMASR